MNSSQRSPCACPTHRLGSGTPQDRPSENEPVANTHRVMILGVDGATLDLIRPWAQEGLLPTFARLMQEGSWGTLRSVVPPVSPTAWSSFLTGTNPGKHGVYDFIGRRPGAYENQLANASHRSGAALWKLLSQAGRRVTVFNVPLTYPVEPVNGLFVSGLLTPPDVADASWPRDLLDQVRQQAPAFDCSPAIILLEGKEQEFVQSIADLNRSTLQAARYLMERQPWDFYMAVFMGADFTSHFRWKNSAGNQAASPAGASSLQAQVPAALQACYRQLDTALGELIEAAGPDVYVVVMSDHGFGSLERYIYVNTWLAERGYLQLRRTPLTLFKRALHRVGITRIAVGNALRRLQVGSRAYRARRFDGMRQAGLGRQPDGKKPKPTAWVQRVFNHVFLSFDDVDWSRTRLFSLGFAGPIYVNLKGRDPQGIVAPGAEYEAVLKQVTADLHSLHDPETGEPLIGEIYRREQLYWGQRTDEAPDLVFLPRDMKNATFGMSGFASRRWLAPVQERTGTHRMDGILFVTGPGIRSGVQLDDSSIMDVAPTVLALMGQPIPAAMDGHVLEEAMTGELRASLGITYATATEEPCAADRPVSFAGEEEELLRERLRGLGYVA